jgi:hypothetical protein
MMARRLTDDQWCDRYKMAKERAYEDDEDPPDWYLRLRKANENAKKRRKEAKNAQK